MNRKRRAAAVTVAALAAASATAAVHNWPRWVPNLSGQICVERPENHGSLNICPADVVIGGERRLMLMGAEAACVFVQGGIDYTVWVQSRDPYDPSASNPAAWRSSDLKVSVKHGGRVELLVCGKSNDSGYASWGLQRADQKCE